MPPQGLHPANLPGLACATSSNVQKTVLIICRSSSLQHCIAAFAASLSETQCEKTIIISTMPRRVGSKLLANTLRLGQAGQRSLARPTEPSPFDLPRQRCSWDKTALIWAAKGRGGHTCTRWQLQAARRRMRCWLERASFAR